MSWGYKSTSVSIAGEVNRKILAQFKNQASGVYKVYYYVWKAAFY